MIRALILALALPGAALAQDRLAASDPEGIVAFLNAEDFPARLSEDSVGDPLIEYRRNTDRLRIFFYDCTDNADCQSLQFTVGYTTEDGVTFDTLNDWNYRERFTRAYMTEGVSRLEMDVVTGADGLTPADFGLAFRTFLDQQEKFELHIGW